MEKSKYEEPPWRIRLLLVMCMSAVAGGIALPASPSLKAFWAMQLYAQSIGLATLGFYTALCALTPKAALSPLLRLCLLLLALPLGYEGGMIVAATVRGDPVQFGAVFRMSRLGMLIMLTSAVFAIILGGSRWRIAELTNSRAEALRLATESKLRLLQAQLEPHMLFNTLANLHSLIEIDPARAQSMVEHLIEFMRCTLSSSRTETTTLRAEFDLISAYLELMLIRMEQRLSYDLQLPDELAQAQIPAMLLQPLVENAIKHGLEPKVEGGTIQVKAEKDGAWLHVYVSDTGRGLSKNADNETYGIAHVKERLHVLYGDRASLSIENQATGGVVSIVKVPL